MPGPQALQELPLYSYIVGRPAPRGIKDAPLQHGTKRHLPIPRQVPFLYRITAHISRNSS